MKYLDLEKWPRRDLFFFFRGMDYPHYNVCAEVDVTNLHGYLKKNNLSLFKTILFSVSKTANEIQEFRLRIRGERVVVHDLVHPSFTVLNKDNVFGFCEARYTDDIRLFLERAEEGIRAARRNPTLTDEPGRDDYLYISSLPWIRFTSISHPIHMHPTDSVPRITWGKHEAVDGKVSLPLSVQVHHALADGYHVGRFFNLLQELIDQPGKMFGPE